MRIVKSDTCVDFCTQMAYAPETCRAKETSINYIVASSWHFTLFQMATNQPIFIVDNIFLRNIFMTCAQKWSF